MGKATYKRTEQLWQYEEREAGEARRERLSVRIERFVPQEFRRWDYSTKVNSEEESDGTNV